MQDLVAVDVVESVQQLLHHLLDLTQRELYIGVAQEAGQVVFAKLKDEIERAFIAIELCRCRKRRSYVVLGLELYHLICMFTRLALSIAICAIGETVFYLAKINKNSSPNWRNVISVIIIDVISKT